MAVGVHYSGVGVAIQRGGSDQLENASGLLKAKGLSPPLRCERK